MCEFENSEVNYESMGILGRLKTWILRIVNKEDNFEEHYVEEEYDEAWQEESIELIKGIEVHDAADVSFKGESMTRSWIVVWECETVVVTNVMRSKKKVM